ncbi:hypothetical protein [Rhizobium leguminosarum]|uniref:hypothetical protein n=1 Tax=Rhizobium leguminosarum TaxID=384 RepID=UPI001C968C7C|nr:hypothetical protein [Rhizobium leguminosarum]MBY5609286.1 hypothetical protein [Rhizobium leguminosarum]MBY5657039.1 hypothetical protein [Rhizobium leguminosarum]
MASNQDIDEVFLSLSPEVQQALNVNGLTLEQVLDRAGVTDLTEVADPAFKPGQRDVFLILIGTAAAVAAATPLITNVVKTLVNKPIVARNCTLAPVFDKDGKPVTDRNGQPLMEWSDTVVIDRPEAGRDFTSKIKTTRDGVEIGIGQG